MTLGNKLRWVPPFLVLLLISSLFITTPFDPDFGWHFTYGKYFVENKEILRENVFSYTFDDYSWANSYWVSQVVLYVLFNFLGFYLASLILGFVYVVTTFVLFKTIIKKDVSVYLAVLVATLIGALFNISDRPLYFSSLFLQFTAVVLLFHNKKAVLLVPLFLLWANMHADFTLGLFMVFVFFVEKIVRNFFNKTLSAKDFLIPAAIAAVTLINPFGFELWKTLLKETNPYQFQVIGEWLPLRQESLHVPLKYLLQYLTWAGVILTFVLNRKSLPKWYLLVSLVFFILSIRSVYFFRVFSLVALPKMLELLSPHLKQLTDVAAKLPTKPMKVLTFYFAVVVATVILSKAFEGISLSLSGEKWETAKEYPREAVTFIKNNPKEGRIFNAYNWGGYLIWKLPEHKTFIDGRMASWKTGNRSILHDYIQMTSKFKENADLFESYVSKYNITRVLLPPEYDMTKELLNSNLWEVELSNEHSVLLLRKDSTADL
jgi:hypothetical protein